MQRATLTTLVAFNYWANHKIVEVCERLTADQWTQTATVSTRTLRGTLVHMLDTEWSWRLRLIDPAARGEEMRQEDFPTVATLVAAWARDERDMTAWIASLSDADLVRPVPVPWGPEYPLWQLIFHLLSHSTQQRAEASTLLTLAGYSPGNVEFLNYIEQV